MLLPGIGLLLLAGQQLQLAPTLGWWGLLMLHVAASVAVVLSFEYAWACIAFWAPRAAEEINSSTWRLITQLAPFPLEGLSALALGSLLTVVPVGLVAWYPSRVLLGIDAPAWAPALLPAAAVLLGAFTTWIFARGLRQYGRTGSTRYLAYGHRR
jgi:ABC-2 type transport system permease protein